MDLERQVVPHLVGGIGRVEQERRPGPGVLEHLLLPEQPELVTGHEVGRLHEVGGADRLRTEAEVGDGRRPGLLRVVDEVALGEQPGVLADDLDRRLVGPHRAVGAEAEEQRRHLAGRAGDGEVAVDVEAQVGHVVGDPDGEAPLGAGRRRG